MRASPQNGNTSYPCGDCGRCTPVTFEVTTTIGRRSITFTLCSPCYRKRERRG